MKKQIQLTIQEVENRNIPTFLGNGVLIAASGFSSIVPRLV